MSGARNSLIEFLPAVLWEKDENREILDNFLHIFEDVFATIEQRVDDIPKLFNPWTTPVEFLPWLAAWVDLDIGEGWSERQLRALLHRIGTLHNKRGTRKGLEQFLHLYVGNFVSVSESQEIPNLFNITINFPDYDYPALRRRARRVFAVVDREKPAHTFYTYQINHPTLQINVHSTIGVDTILGTETGTQNA